MSCKSAIYAANTNGQTLAVGSTINFGTISRRYGNNLNLSGGNVILLGAGYYDIDTNFTFLAAAGTATITLYRDGVAIPGATASITTAANGTYSISIPAIIREFCCKEAVITAVITGVAVTMNNAAIAVEKI